MIILRCDRCGRDALALGIPVTTYPGIPEQAGLPSRAPQTLCADCIEAVEDNGRSLASACPTCGVLP